MSEQARWERTGEWREPKEHEWYEYGGRGYPMQCGSGPHESVWILRRIEPAPAGSPERGCVLPMTTPEQLAQAILDITPAEWCRQAVLTRIRCYRHPDPQAAARREAAEAGEEYLRKWGNLMNSTFHAMMTQLVEACKL